MAGTERRAIVAAVALTLSACGSSATAPTPTPPAPTTYTLTGSLLATNGGQPVSAAVTIAGTAATSTSSGFAVTLPQTVTGALSATIAGAGIVERHTFVAGGQSRTVALDAIALDGRFDLPFYRLLARDASENSLVPLRRWTTTPRIYLKTVDEAGAAIDAATLDLIDTTIREAVPEWTSGALSTPTVERGTGTREGVSGWITVKFPAVVSARCGLTQVATDGGWLELEYHNPKCRCGSEGHARRSVRHEVGHALGFYHTDTAADVMWPNGWPSTDVCSIHPDARELYHAAIVYRRAPGNVDPDSDATSSTPLGAGPHHRVSGAGRGTSFPGRGRLGSQQPVRDRTPLRRSASRACRRWTPNSR